MMAKSESLRCSALQLLQHDSTADSLQPDYPPNTPEARNSAEAPEVVPHSPSDLTARTFSVKNHPIAVNCHAEEKALASVKGRSKKGIPRSTRKQQLATWIFLVMITAIVIGAGIGIGVKARHLTEPRLDASNFSVWPHSEHISQRYHCDKLG